MVKLLYITVGGYKNYNHRAQPGENNPAGGMPFKTITVTEIWEGFYKTIVSEYMEECADARILVVEPLWFRLRGNFSPGLHVPDLEESVSQYENHNARLKVLYTSELSFTKIPVAYRDRIIQASDVVTANCQYQRRMFDMIGINSLRLTDPVREGLFYSENIDRELSVFAMGKIGTIKNTQKVIEIFRALEGKVNRVYIGGASLWGFSSSYDERLEKELRHVTDEFHFNIPSIKLGKLLSQMACGIFDTFHDSASTSSMESLMAGVYSFFGLHETWRERPGIHNLDTIDDFVDALAGATNNFKELPSADYYKTSREWAMKEYSQSRFLEDWKGIIKHAS